MGASILVQLAAAMRTYLSDQFGGGTDEVLAFEAFGIPVDPNTFRKGQGPFNPMLVAEHLLRLTNKIGQISAGEFHRHWTATEVVHVVAKASTVADAKNEKAFASIKAPAEEAFQSASPTFPTKANPDDWYDVSVDTNWTTGQGVSSDSESMSTSAGDPRSVDLADNWELRIVPPDVKPSLDALSNPDAYLAVAPVGDRAVAVLAPANGTASSGPTTPTGPATGPGSSSMAMTDAPAPSSSRTATAVATAPTTIRPVDNFAVAPDAVVAAAPATSAEVASPSVDTRRVSDIAANPDLMLGVLAGIDGKATTHLLSSSSLTLSFDLCPVQIDRDWWSWMLVRTPGWTLPLWAAGQLVPGLPTAGSTPPPCALPTTMLVIRNLQVSGWTSTDLEVLPRAASLGPFSFAAGIEISTSSGTLTAKGMQVFGWVCQLVPPLPPVGAA